MLIPNSERHLSEVDSELIHNSKWKVLVCFCWKGLSGSSRCGMNARAWPDLSKKKTKKG